VKPRTRLLPGRLNPCRRATTLTPQLHSEQATFAPTLMPHPGDSAPQLFRFPASGLHVIDLLLPRICGIVILRHAEDTLRSTQYECALTREQKVSPGLNKSRFIRTLLDALRWHGIRRPGPWLCCHEAFLPMLFPASSEQCRQPQATRTS